MLSFYIFHLNQCRVIADRAADNVNDASKNENTQTCVHMCACVWEYVSAVHVVAAWVG